MSQLLSLLNKVRVPLKEIQLFLDKVHTVLVDVRAVLLVVDTAVESAASMIHDIVDDKSDA